MAEAVVERRDVNCRTYGVIPNRGHSRAEPAQRVSNALPTSTMPWCETLQVRLVFRGFSRGQKEFTSRNVSRRAGTKGCARQIDRFSFVRDETVCLDYSAHSFVRRRQHMTA